MTNKVEICGVNTSKLPVLSREEKNKLFIKIKNGDLQARETFVKGNLRLVLSVIQRFNNRGENVDDLFQVGCIGLIKAIDNFDTTLDVKFSTYAVPMIAGELRRFLRDFQPMRVSRSLRDLAYKAMQAKEQLICENQKEPTVEQIADTITEKPSQVVIALEAITDPVSLYEPVYSDNGDALYVLDQVSDNCDDKSWLEELSLKQAMSELQPRERNILFLRFFKGQTQVEVAKNIGISQAQVSRLEKGALEHIKKSI